MSLIFFGETALFYAVKGKLIEGVKILLENRADVNIRNNNGESILSVAKDSEIIKLLKDAGAKD